MSGGDFVLPKIEGDFVWGAFVLGGFCPGGFCPGLYLNDGYFGRHLGFLGSSKGILQDF